MGFLKAIMRARSITVKRNPANLEFLMSRWSIETHTFLASWGGFFLALEDVAMLTSLPLFDEAHATGVMLKGEDQKKADYLTKSLSSSNHSTNKATYLSWVKYFNEGDGRYSPFQFELFSFFFPSPPEDGLDNYVFLLVVLLARE